MSSFSEREQEFLDTLDWRGLRALYEAEVQTETEGQGAWRRLAVALEQLAETLAEPNERSGALLSSGEIWRDHLEEFDKALELFNSAWTNDRNNLAALSSGRDLYRRLGRPDMVVRLLTFEMELLPEGPAQAKALTEIAEILALELDNEEGAVTRLEMALALDPTNQDARTLYEDLTGQSPDDLTIAYPGGEPPVDYSQQGTATVIDYSMSQDAATVQYNETRHNAETAEVEAAEVLYEAGDDVHGRTTAENQAVTDTLVDEPAPTPVEASQEADSGSDSHTELAPQEPVSEDPGALSEPEQEVELNDNTVQSEDEKLTGPLPQDREAAFAELLWRAERRVKRWESGEDEEDLSLALYQQAAELKPDDLEVRWSLAERLGAAGSLDEARQLLDSALADAATS
ncbi:MAG: hypothetical protein KC561_08825, partial [Myxococcales bacterium]|nr:hypothetical protein [Myxococcales bacterium]